MSDQPSVVIEMKAPVTPPEKLIHNSLHCNSQEGKEEPNPQQLNQKNEATEAIKSNSSIEMFEKNPLIVLADSIEAFKSEDTCDLLPSVHNSPEKTSNYKHSDGETKRTYICEYCSYSCPSKSNLQAHINTHNGVKPYFCPICDYTCTLNGNLKTHMRVHTGEKPFKCELCSYSSTQRGNLRKHIMTHTGEKPWQCQECPYSCADSSTLKKHMNTHKNIKPFQCSVCNCNFTTRASLKRHLRSHGVSFVCVPCNITSATGEHCIHQNIA